MAQHFKFQIRNRNRSLIRFCAFTCTTIFAYSENIFSGYAADVGKYVPLAPIQGFIDANVIQQSTQSLGAYVNEMFRLGVAAAGFLAVIMIIVGGIQYIGSDVVTSKSEARAKIENAILGLLLALSSYLILKTINQDFLVTDLSLEQQTIGVNQESGAATIGPSFDKQNAASGTAFNPIISTVYNQSGALITTYQNGASQAFYIDGDKQYVANYDQNGELIGSPRLVSAVSYSSTKDANGNYLPTTYYYADGGQSSPSGTGSTFGSTAGVNGTILNMTQQGKTFDNPEWNRHALAEIQRLGLTNLSPADVATYFPNANGQPTAEDWLHLLAAISYRETNFRADRTYREDNIPGRPLSVGLFQLSVGDAAVRNLQYSEQDLKDPFKNITAGIQTMINTLQSGNCISCSNGTYQSGAYAGQPRYIGATAYWSVLRPTQNVPRR